LCFAWRMKTPRFLTALAVAAGFIILMSMSLSARAARGDYWVYFGSYASEKGQGIYVSRLDARTGKLSPPEVAAETPNPSFVAIHQNGKFLYAVAEIGNFAGKKSGAVRAFRIDSKTGKLELLNEVPSGGGGPCFVSIDRSGRNLLVANYGGGSVSVVRILEDGKLGETTAFVQHQGSGAVPGRQATPHAHSINLTPDNRYAMVADLGLDKVLIYRFDADKGTLTANDPAFVQLSPGSGPRHFAFHPDGKRAYVINEINSTVTVFEFDAAKGSLKEIQTLSTLPAGYSGKNSTAEIRIHPSGRFVYGSNRGMDSVAVFKVNKPDGKLSPAGHCPTQGKTPRNFGIDPEGKFLLAAHQNSDSVVVFRINAKTGMPEPTGQTLQMHQPVCVKFLAIP
jgi:6-phosphogluconolactonase